MPLVSISIFKKLWIGTDITWIFSTIYQHATLFVIPPSPMDFVFVIVLGHQIARIPRRMRKSCLNLATRWKMDSSCWNLLRLVSWVWRPFNPEGRGVVALRSFIDIALNSIYLLFVLPDKVLKNLYRMNFMFFQLNQLNAKSSQNLNQILLYTQLGVHRCLLTIAQMVP